jgi:hypothetical protein
VRTRAAWLGRRSLDDRTSGDRLRDRRGVLSTATAAVMTPLVVVGYLGAAGLLVLPLLALRGLFPRRHAFATAGV